jgi:hypothetical protein
VSSGDFSVRYPVDLPRGSVKKLFTYSGAGGIPNDFTLETDHGAVVYQYNAPITGMFQGLPARALDIGDSPGSLAFIRRVENQGQQQYYVSGHTAPLPSDSAVGLSTAYCLPADAPDRMAGYDGASVIVLGQGSERLSNAAVNALKFRVLSGATLVFIGGAGSSALEDPRWSELLTIGNLHVENVDHSDVMAKLGGTVPPPFTVTSGDPSAEWSASREHGALLSALRSFGAGRVLYLAFNPFESPLNVWDGRRAAVLALIRPSEAAVMATEAEGQQEQVTGIQSAKADPFSIQMPSLGWVFALLGAYFIVVVPVSFLVLRKLGRGELAWITAPLLSAGFAGAILSSARSLYSAKLSTATQGLLIHQDGLGDSLFRGRSQIFIPTGGTYDLQMHGVDSIGAPQTQWNNFGMRNQPSLADLNPIDVGEVRVPEMRARNLSFTEMSYAQEFLERDWLQISKTPSGWMIVNQGPYVLRLPTLWVGHKDANIVSTSMPASRISDFAPGQSRVVPNHALQPPNSDTLNYTFSRDDTVMVTAEIEGFRPGPQIGDVVDSRTGINLVEYGTVTP